MPASEPLVNAKERFSKTRPLIPTTGTPYGSFTFVENPEISAAIDVTNKQSRASLSKLPFGERDTYLFNPGLTDAMKLLFVDDPRNRLLQDIIENCCTPSEQVLSEQGRLKIRTLPLQSGFKSFIVLGEAGQSNFILTFSRGPKGGVLDYANRTDRNNLLSAHSLFAKKLKEEVEIETPAGTKILHPKEKYRIVLPSAHGYVSDYYVYATPFVSDAAELHMGNSSMQLTPESGERIIIPFMFYAYPFTRGMKETARRQYLHAQNLQTALIMRANRATQPFTLDDLYRTLHDNNDFMILSRQISDILIHMSLLYRLSGNHAPPKININSGDYLGLLDSRLAELNNLTLIALSGEYDLKPMSEDQWIQTMTDYQVQNIDSKEKRQPFQTFAKVFGEEYFWQILKTADSFIDKL